MINTFILIGSSVTMVMVGVVLKMNDQAPLLPARHRPAVAPSWGHQILEFGTSLEGRGSLAQHAFRDLLHADGCTASTSGWIVVMLYFLGREDAQFN